MRRAALCWFATILFLTGCNEGADFTRRTAVGTVPEGFRVRALASSGDVAAYTEAYIRALGLEGVRVARVVKVGNRYYVYTAETETNRGAFVLEVGTGGEIDVKRFPTMDPEMMWNQKYGHRARPKESAIHMKRTVQEATDLAEKAVAKEPLLALGKPETYYGYYLFPLYEGTRLVGEAAVNAADGRVVWDRFLELPEEIPTGD